MTIAALIIGLAVGVALALIVLSPVLRERRQRGERIIGLERELAASRAHLEAAERSGAAILAIPVAGTLKRVRGDHTIEETVSREALWEAQTPQVFRRQLLLDAYAARAGFQATDEAQLIERAGQAVTVVRGSPVNLKITSQEDLRLAEQALKALPKPKFANPAHPFAGDDMWR